MLKGRGKQDMWEMELKEEIQQHHTQQTYSHNRNDTLYCANI